MAEHETHYEIRIGAKPNDHHRRTIGISPPLPQDIVELIHNQKVIGLPFLRFGTVSAPDSEPYSETTFFPDSFRNEIRADNIALEIAGILRQQIMRSNAEALVEIDSRLYPTDTKTWLFNEKIEAVQTRLEPQKLAA